MSLAWDDRLMSRDEAFGHAAAWPVRPGFRRELAFLDCAKCGQAVMVLGAAAAPFTTTLEHEVAAVLRHMVTAHGHVTNRRNHGRHPAGTPAPAAGSGHRSAVAAAAGRRHEHQAAGPGGISGPAEGDQR